MQRLDLALPTPAENLACDEALLDWAEGGGEPVLRFWEPRSPFVVVGYANRVASEVDTAACVALGVPILRRCTGGGTVLQGPGCLNYSLVLRLDAGSPLAGITSANRFIMDRNRDALATALGLPIELQGHTDLALAGRKFSGNAQRRHRSFLLFHGCFLLDETDLPLIGRCLRVPSKEPPYRQNRSHADFLTRLCVPAEEIKQVLAHAWGAEEVMGDPVLEETRRLAAEKYSKDEWNFRF